MRSLFQRSQPIANSFGMMYYHTGCAIMATAKIAITIDQNTLNRLDLLVKSRIFPNRSRAIQEAVTEKIERLEKADLRGNVLN